MSGAAGKFTPLCPAGHLPLKGGDCIRNRLSRLSGVAVLAGGSPYRISPFEGEMPGRAEGGNARILTYNGAGA